MLNEHTRDQITKMAAGLLKQGMTTEDGHIYRLVPDGSEFRMAWCVAFRGRLSDMKSLVSDFEERPAEVLHLIADGLRAKAKELERREPEPDGSEKLVHFAH